MSKAYRNKLNLRNENRLVLATKSGLWPTKKPSPDLKMRNKPLFYIDNSYLVQILRYYCIACPTHGVRRSARLVMRLASRFLTATLLDRVHFVVAITKLGNTRVLKRQTC